MAVNLEGLVPHKVTRFGGMCDWDDPVQIPNGLALACQNMQFLADSVKTRWGLREAAAGTDTGNPTGLDVLTVLGELAAPLVEQQSGGALRLRSGMRTPRDGGEETPPANRIGPNTQVGIVFTDAGELFLELPAGSGTLTPIGSDRIAASIKALLPAGAVMQTAKAYNRIYMAFSDLEKGLAPVLALDAATGWVSPVGQNPVAAPWQKNTFYQQGDIVTSTTNPAVWFRRLNTGYSGATEPTWPAALGFFTSGYTAHYARATDGGSDPEWQEWTPGFPFFLPTPPPITSLAHTPGGGTIAAGLDVYVRLAYANDLGESLWTAPVVFAGTSATDQITGTFGTADAASGPPMPSWLMSVMPLGTASGLHWPGANCLKVYVASVAHNASAPTQYRLYALISADEAVVINSVPGAGTLFTPPLEPTAAISTEQFKGEGGIRNAILLRENSMGDLSGADPQGVLPVTFPGAQYQPATISVGAFVPQTVALIPASEATIIPYAYDPEFPSSVTIQSGTYYAQLAKVVGGVEVGWTPVYGPFFVRLDPYRSFQAVMPGDATEDGWRIYYGNSATTLDHYLNIANNITNYGVRFVGTAVGGGVSGPKPKYMYISLDDISQFAPGMAVDVENPIITSWNGRRVITAIYPDQDVEWNGTSFVGTQVGFPAGTLVIYDPAGFEGSAAPQAGSVGVKAGPCPVAIIPPGVQEGPGYTHDVLAFTVAGLGRAGPFNYLASTDPPNPFSTSILSETTDGNGNGYGNVLDSSGLSAGETVAIKGWTGGNVALNGQRVLASANSVARTTTFPDSFAAGTYAQAGVTMEVVPSLPTIAVPGEKGIVLQFDDATLPEGVDVTDNLLFVALPPCIDLAYLPSVRRMCYVSDRQPTTFIFSEADFMGEIDGLNDVLSIEPSNGARAIGARELLTGMMIGCKESGGYQIIPTADAPANWGTNRLWAVHGPASGRNIATGPDGSTGLDFLMFVDPESGLFKWPPRLGEDELDWLSKELSGANNQDAVRMATWDRVDRSMGRHIQVVVDDIAKEVKISVPLIPPVEEVEA